MILKFEKQKKQTTAIILGDKIKEIILIGKHFDCFFDKSVTDALQ